MKENIKNFFKILLLGLYFIGFISLVMIFITLAGEVIKGKVTMDPMLWYSIVNIALYVLAFLLPYLIFKWVTKYKPEVNFFEKGNKDKAKKIFINIIWCIVTGLTLQLLGMCISGMSTWMIGENTLTNSMSNFTTALPIWIPAALIAIPPAVCEELIYRGAIYDTSKKYFSPFVAACISSVLFGVMHLDLQQFPYTVVLGFAFVLIYEKSRSILTTMFIHFFIDFSQMYLVLLEVKTFGTDFADADQGITWQFVLVLSLLGIIFALWNAKIIKNFKNQKDN